MHQGTNKQTVWPLVAQREVSSHQPISITEKWCPLQRPACLSMCGESRKCCSCPLLQLILSVQIIAAYVCVCTYVCRYTIIALRTALNNYLKLKCMDLGNGKWKTSDSCHPRNVLLLGILVHRKFPLILHFCRYPLKNKISLHSMSVYVCTFTHGFLWDIC